MFKVTSKVHSDTDYSHDGKVVSLKGHPQGATTTISDEELEHLKNNQVFQLHRKNGFIAVDEIVEEAEAESLLGSSTQPATFLLDDDSTVSLGDVVAKAFEAYGKPPAQWNKLADKTREAKIQAVVDTLPLKAGA